MPLCQAGTGLTQTRFSPTGRLSPAGSEMSVLGREEGRKEAKRKKGGRKRGEKRGMK